MEIKINCSVDELLRLVDRIRVIDPMPNDCNLETVSRLAKMDIGDVLNLCDRMKEGCSDD